MLAGTWLPAQTFAEHSASAAGGSAAGVAGKTVSDSIDRVMGRGVSGSLEKATRPGSTTVTRPVTKAEKETDPAAATETSSTAGAAVPRTQGHHPRVIPTPVVRRRTTESRRTHAAQYALPPPAPTVAALKSIKPGVSRKDVVSKLGPPTDRIQMADESGHLAEVMHYVTPASDLGTVRMSDGVVTEVTVAN
jgi:hypothetical protein